MNINMNIDLDVTEILEELQYLEGEKNGDKYEEVVTVSDNYPRIEPGTYVAITNDVEIEKKARSMYGINDKVRVSFTVFNKTEEGNSEKVNIKQTYWKSRADKSAYYRYLKEILGRDPRKGFQLKELLGVTCKVVISHNKTDNGTYENIDDITRVSMKDNLDNLAL